MDLELKKNMFDYYDEVASEYETGYNDLYTLADSSLPDPNAYKREARFVSMLAHDFITGSVIDIGCGSGFFLPHYAPNCSSITLLDQSPKMLSGCKEKVNDLGIRGKCILVCADFFGHDFDPNTFDSAVVTFFLSHLTKELESAFFQILRRILRPDGRFLIADCIWTKERAKRMVKVGRQQRTLSDGRAFDIYKRYFDKRDLETIGEEYGLNLTIVHAGRVSVAAIGTFNLYSGRSR